MITIEKATYGDIEDLTKLYEELLGRETNLQKFIESFNLIDSNNNYTLVVAKDKDKNIVGSILGIICYDLGGDCKPFMVIENLIVKNGYRGMGIGKQLMTFLEELAQERNCYFTMLESTYRRKEAHKFYEAIGYANDVVKGFKKYL
jgi:predicted N-acetyltransferase YhbS